MEIPEDKQEAIRDAIRGGTENRILAIKLVREATGCGLVEAKEFVESLAGSLAPKANSIEWLNELPEGKRQEILASIYGGASRKIATLKLVREASGGMGLAEAKAWVESASAELYAKTPEKFSEPPNAKGGCAGVIALTALFIAGACVLIVLMTR